MIELKVQLTADQYTRFKTSFTSIMKLESLATDEQLTSQLKREAAAITYANEVGNGDGSDWSF